MGEQEQPQAAEPPAHVDSASDDRTVNNAARHQYRVLSDAEKARMTAVKDQGAAFLQLIEELRSPSFPADPDDPESMHISAYDRELNIAAERIEEAVMWAVKHITA